METGPAAPMDGPDATATRATSKWTRNVDIQGEGTRRWCRASWSMSEAIGAMILAAKESDWMGYKAGWMAQRAAHVASRNDSEQRR